MKPVHVLNINQFSNDDKEDFHTNTLENHLQTRHKDIAEPHSHNFYLAILFTKGTGRHEIDFADYEVKSGALFFLNPGQTHHWTLSPDTEGYIFFHTRDYYEQYYTQNKLSAFPFFFSMHSSPCIYLQGKELRQTESYFNSIFEESLSGNSFKKPAIMSYINLIYISTSRIFQETANTEHNHTNNNYYTKFRQFESLVEEHFIQEKQPVFYAEKMHITPRHLNRIAQIATGKTATDAILDRVLLEAKKELVLRRGNFKSIAEVLGYTDYAYFSRIFKNKTGETPSDFTKRYTKA